MKADLRNKRLASNVIKTGQFSVLKTTGIYGPNNAGKTNVIRCIHCIWSVLTNRGFSASPNLFTNNPVIELGITFVNGTRMFSYDFKFDISKNEYIYERFLEHKRDANGNEKEEIWLLKDFIHGKFHAIDKGMETIVSVISKNNILMYLIDTVNFNHLNEMKKLLSGIAGKIDIVDMNNIPIGKTVELLKNKDSICEKVVNFIKNADLYLEDYYFADTEQFADQTEVGGAKPQENVLNFTNQLAESMKLTSVYKGIKVPSLWFDSTGTKKIAALASFIIEALEKGRILVVDELDSSIHFKLTRAIVAMFNNELNTKAQLIFTVHDVNLMDCKKLFRKEQIWFVNKDDEGVYMFSLADFTARDGVRDTTDIIEKYRKGALGALPEPELINTLLDIQKHQKTND